ncbi:MAG TPA: HDOD domain-containing protein [Capillimicrobium sp.]|jgi:EAL and modified HD-GYP domain-containing signal transduction protein
MSAAPVIVARQPVVDRHRKTLGYELLFRAHDRERAMVVDAEQATAHVLVTAMVDIGLPALVGGRKAAINVSRDFLLSVSPLPFGPAGVVLELLEDQDIDDELIDRCVDLVTQGYEIALDDFTWTPEIAPLVPLARYIKLDVRAHGLDGLPAQLAALDGFAGFLVAEKVEDEAEFAACRDLGFHLFQGWFHCRPEIVEGRAASTSTLDTLRSAATVASDELTFEELEELVSRDPALTVRLLRLLNSAAVPTNRTITTVHDALVMLGERTVRQWTMLILLAGLPATSDTLLPTALIRARLLEQLAAERRDPEPGGAFVVGLFSIADVLLGMSMDDVLADIPLAPAHADALLRLEGPNGRALAAALAHERGESWRAELAGVAPERFGAAYLEAIGFAQTFGPTLSAED